MYISSVLAHPQQDFLDPYQFHSFMLTITWSMTCTKTIQQQWHNFSRKSHLHHTKLAGSQKGTIRSRCIHLPPSKRELLGATRTSSTPFASKDTYIYIYEWVKAWSSNIYVCSNEVSPGQRRYPGAKTAIFTDYKRVPVRDQRNRWTPRLKRLGLRTMAHTPGTREA